ncbi:MAG: hypothetical protein V4658_00655 [Bacteroidota bacterium]
MKTAFYFKIIFLLVSLLLVCPAWAQKKTMLYPADTMKRTAPKPVMPYMDSVTRLVTYSQTVEQDETASDSLYTRAMRFCRKLNGNSTEERRNQKLVFHISLPAYYYDSIGIKTNAGNIVLGMAVFIKEGRYRYIISGIGNDPLNPVITFEYALLFPNMLHNAHEDINQLIRDFKRHMAEQEIYDEDEW